MTALSRIPSSRGSQWIAFATSLALATLALEPIAQAAPPTAAPAANADEVRLTNGGFVRGQVVEMMPGEYVVIKLVTAEIRRFEWSQVASVERGGTTTTGSTAPVDPVVVPTPDPEPQPEPQPDPEPVVDEPDDGGPSSTTPHVRLTVFGKRSVSLQRVTGRAVAYGSGGSAQGVSFSRVCASPCDMLVPDPRDEFFVIGDKYTGSKTFTLDNDASVYELRVTPRSKGLLIGGWVMIAMMPATTALLAVLPFLVNMKRQDATATYALAGVTGTLMLGGGITMMVFGRTKVEVLPRDRAWLETH
jgi:hypothetical protein